MDSYISLALISCFILYQKEISKVDFDNDLVLNKLDDELHEINKSQLSKLQKIKDEQPENW